METLTSLFTYFYSLLTADTALQTLMGGTVVIHPQWQSADTPKPYIVQTLDMRSTDAPWPLRNGTLQLHLWSGTPDAGQILKMRERIVVLLENRHFATSEVNSCRCRLFSEGFVPDEPGVWHFVIQFNLRLYKSAEAEAIINRE